MTVNKELGDEGARYILLANDRIFTIASSALALTVTFRSSLVTPSTLHIEYLNTVWCGLVLCIVCGIFRLWTSGAGYIDSALGRQKVGLFMQKAGMFFAAIESSSFVLSLGWLARFAVANNVLPSSATLVKP